MSRFLIFVCGCVLFLSSGGGARANQNYDVVVYGGTSGGIVAAIQAARMGKSVALIEPGRHIGGLTAGGLGATDIGNKAAIGGLSRSFYRKVGAYYADDAHWTYQQRSSYNERRRSANEEEMWTFEPHVAERIYHEWLAEFEVPLVIGERLDLEDGIERAGGRIVAIVMESGRRFAGRTFIDATYEGDLLAEAGVSYTVGREANSQYGETLNGVQVRHAVKHQFIVDVDPYVVPGDPSSGLLPLVQSGPPGSDGQGDHRVQAYNFRMCTTDVPENRREWPKPAGYDVRQYELLLRNLEAGDHRVPWNPVWMPNRKTDTNNNYAISTDAIGMNYDYPEAGYAARARIVEEHKLYQQGLCYTLANNPRVPAKVRAEFQRLGLAKDEFADNDNWPHQLYVREARRMVSDYVMTQHHCQGREVAEYAVGLAAYTMDSHNTQRYVNADGYVRNEGDVQVGGFSPYPIDYGSIRPKKSECKNLLAPMCLSATHIAYGSIRMEPVFMVLGQSAATAACQAIDQGVAVQDVDLARLRTRLLADGQVLEWTGPKRKPPIDPAGLDGVVVDETDAEISGVWLNSSSISGYVGFGYLHDNDAGKGAASAVYAPEIEEAGVYEVRLYYTANPNRATNVPVTVKGAEGEKTVTVNQRQPAKNGYSSLGSFRLAAGNSNRVTISNAGTNGHVIADAVQFVAVERD